MRTISVLIIDDSALVRKILTQELSKDSQIEVIGSAPDPYIGRDKIVTLKPDVVLLDIEMPRMDGLTFLEKLMKYYPMPVIIISSLAKNNCDLAIKCLELGAADVVPKPGGSYSVGDMSEQLIDRIKGIKSINTNKLFNKSNEVKAYNQALLKNTYLNSNNQIIAIGASTGGTEAIKHVLTNLPPTMPPIVIVQHMPQYFTKSFADSVNNLSQLYVKEAENNESVTPGKVLIAPGNKHMALRKRGSNYYVEIFDGPLVFHQRPAVEILFDSVAECACPNAMGIILTGMGKDGAKGLLNMKKAGAFTIAQDEASCVVFGMPKEAVQVGAAQKILSLDSIPGAMVNYLKSNLNNKEKAL